MKEGKEWFYDFFHKTALFFILMVKSCREKFTFLL